MSGRQVNKVTGSGLDVRGSNPGYARLFTTTLSIVAVRPTRPAT